MELEQLKYFVEVCQTKNFTIAADNMFVSQSSISKKIQALEHELGVKLLNRRKNPLALTAAGEYLLAQAVKILDLTAQAEHQTRQIGAGRVGTLRIGIGDQIDINSLLPGFLKEFVEEEPMIDVQLSVHNRDLLPHLLQSEQLDVIFWEFAGERNEVNKMSFIPIKRTCPRLYYSSQHPKAKRPNLSPSDFLENTMYTVGYENSESEKRLKEIGLEFRHVVRVTSMQILKIMVESNMGVTVLGVSHGLESSGRILSLPIHMDFEVGTDCIFQNDPDNAALQKFLDFLKKYMKL